MELEEPTKSGQGVTTAVPSYMPVDWQGLSAKGFSHSASLLATGGLLQSSKQQTFYREGS